MKVSGKWNGQSKFARSYLSQCCSSIPWDLHHWRDPTQPELTPGSTLMQEREPALSRNLLLRSTRPDLHLSLLRSVHPPFWVLSRRIVWELSQEVEWTTEGPIALCSTVRTRQVRSISSPSLLSSSISYFPKVVEYLLCLESNLPPFLSLTHHLHLHSLALLKLLGRQRNNSLTRDALRNSLRSIYLLMTIDCFELTVLDFPHRRATRWQCPSGLSSLRNPLLRKYCHPICSTSRSYLCKCFDLSLYGWTLLSLQGLPGGLGQPIQVSRSMQMVPAVLPSSLVAVQSRLYTTQEFR